MKLAPLSAIVLVALAAGQAFAAKPLPADTSVAPPTDADMRTPDPKDLLVIETTKGRVLVELNDVAAATTADRVRTLARQGVYDGRVFFRVIDNFMDQTGDPVDSGVGASSLPNLPPEFTFKRGTDTPFALVFKTNGVEEGFVGSLPLISQTMDLGLLTADHRVQAWGTYCAGVLGMARSDDPASGNSQFFLMRTNARSITAPTRSTRTILRSAACWLARTSSTRSRPANRWPRRKIRCSASRWWRTCRRPAGRRCVWWIRPAPGPRRRSSAPWPPPTR